MSCGIVPKTIVAGLKFTATFTLPAYGDGWQLLMYLRGPASIDLSSTLVGSTYTFSEAPEVTALWAPGLYAYTVRATDGFDVVEVEGGQLTIDPDLVSLPAGHDPRTENQIALDAINAILAKRATLDQQRYRINNRELYRESIKELLRLRSLYSSLVRAERRKACGQTSWQQVKVHMRPMGSG